MGELLLMLALLFGFVMVAYVNVDYTPDEDRNDEDDWF